MGGGCAMAWGLAAAAATGLGYYRACGAWRPAYSLPARPSFREYQLACLGLAHALLASLFGCRYWNIRGLGTTAALCWAVYGLAVLVRWNAMSFGESGYPAIAALIFCFLALLPFLVHAILHATRCCLAHGIASVSTWNSHVAAVVIPLFPVAVSLILLLPVAFLAAMADGESLVPRAPLRHWFDLSWMLTLGWAMPGAPGLLSVVGVLLNGPALILWMYLVSYATWAAFRLLIRDAGAHCTLLVRHPMAMLATIHALYAFLLALGLGEILGL